MAQALAFFTGLLVGSFLNVCIWRMPRNESIAWPGSHCPSCKTPIFWYDNIPVFAYIRLRGRCHSCQTRIPFRYPMVELLGGFAGFLAFSWWTLPYALMGTVIFWALIVLTWIDIEHQIIPDEISVGGIVAGVIFTFFFPDWVGASAGWMSLRESAIGVISGGGFLFFMAVVGEKIFKKEAMGGGDVKLLAAIGAFFGWKGALFTIFIGSIAGSFVGIGVKLVTKKEEIPFGPYLALGIFIYMLFGGPLLSWYMGRMLQY
jgi:leader peptidase (prepilin peptidase)/N-methyltransferase